MMTPFIKASASMQYLYRQYYRKNKPNNMKKKNSQSGMIESFLLAAVLGFEPRNGGVRVPFKAAYH